MYEHGYHQSTIIPLPPPYLYFGTAYASTLPIVMYVDATFYKVEYECVTCLVFGGNTGASGQEMASGVHYILLWLPYSWLELPLCM